MDFDEDRLYYSHQALRRDTGENGENAEEEENEQDLVQTNAVRRHFREFLSK